MTSFLDIRTLSVVIGITLFALGLSMAYYSRNNKIYPGFGKWTIGIFLNCIGFILMGCRHFLSPFFTIVIANICIYSALVFFYSGFMSFTQKRVNVSANVIFVILFSLILHPYFTYVSHNVDARIMISSFAAAGYFLLCAVVLIKDIRRVIRKRNTMLLITLISIVFLFFIRGMYPLVSGLELSDYLAGGTFYEIALLLVIVLSVLFVIGVMQLNSQMLEHELRSEHEKLQENEERYRRLVEQSKQGLTIVQNHPFRFLFVNRSIEDITGYSNEELMAFGSEELKELIHPDDWEMFYDRLESRLAGKDLSPITTFRIIRKDGRQRWVEIYSSLFTYQNKPTIHATFWDITERKEVENALSQQFHFERLITEISSEFLLMEYEDVGTGIQRALEAVGKFVMADRAYVFQYHEDGKLADNIYEWCAKGIAPQKQNLKNLPIQTDLPWFSNHINQWEIISIPNVATLPPEAGAEKAHFEQQGIQSMVVAPMVLKNQLVGFVGFDAVAKRRQWTENELVSLRLIGEVFTNAIERKRVGMRLLESEERWSFALEGAGDGVWDWDAATNRVYFSSQWKTMLGYDEQDIENTLDEWERRVHPDDMERVQEDLERHIRGETPVYQNEHRVLCKDGSYKWVLDRGKIVERTEDGKPKRFIGTHADISKIKAAEAEREKLIFELQDALSQVKTLSGLLPICSICKNIRDDKGYWNQLETYMHQHSDIQFSHGLCPDCAKKYYPEIDLENE